MDDQNYDTTVMSDKEVLDMAKAVKGSAQNIVGAMEELLDKKNK